METKKCTKCGEEKALDQFYSETRSQCRCCMRAANKANRQANPEKENARKAGWNKANPEKVKAQKAKHRESNREGERIRVKAYREKNIEAERARSKSYANSMPASYVAAALRISVAELTPELIELKREQLRIHRLTKQLKQEIQNV